MGEPSADRRRDGPADEFDRLSIEADLDHEQISRQYSLFLQREIHHHRRRRQRQGQGQGQGQSQSQSQSQQPRYQRPEPPLDQASPEAHSPRPELWGVVGHDEPSRSASPSGKEPLEALEPVEGSADGSADGIEHGRGQENVTMTLNGAELKHKGTPGSSSTALDTSNSASNVSRLYSTTPSGEAGPPEQETEETTAEENAAVEQILPLPMAATNSPGPIEVDEDVMQVDEGFYDEGVSRPGHEITTALDFLGQRRPWGTTRMRRSADAAAGSYAVTHNPPRMRRTKRKHKMRQRPTQPRNEAT